MPEKMQRLGEMEEEDLLWRWEIILSAVGQVL